MSETSPKFKKCLGCNKRNDRPERRLCRSCSKRWAKIDDGLSHGMTCSQCFKRITGDRLGEFLKLADEHDAFCEKHPETWSPDRDVLDAGEVPYLCGAAARLCNQRNDFSDAGILRALEEVAPKFSSDVKLASKGMREKLRLVVLNMLGRQTGMT